MAQVFPRGGDPLRRIAVEQLLRRDPLGHESELPGEIVGIVDAGIGAAHAEDRQKMRGVAGKQHAPVAVIVERERVGLVDADPDRVPRALLAHHTQQTLDARHDIFRLDRLIGVFAVAQLIVDAPDA